MADLSITGARILGRSPVSFGERVDVEGAGLRLAAKVVRVEPAAFAVAFDHTLETRVAMVKRFYGGGYIRPLETIDVRKVGVAIVRRVFL